jgi:hypothetical protein
MLKNPLILTGMSNNLLEVAHNLHLTKYASLVERLRVAVTNAAWKSQPGVRPGVRFAGTVIEGRYSKMLGHKVDAIRLYRKAVKLADKYLGTEPLLQRYAVGATREIEHMQCTSAAQHTGDGIGETVEQQACRAAIDTKADARNVEIDKVVARSVYANAVTTDDSLPGPGDSLIINMVLPEGKTAEEAEAMLRSFC